MFKFNLKKKKSENNMKIMFVALVIWMLQIQGLYGIGCDAPCLYVASIQSVFRIQVNQTTGLLNSTPELLATSKNAQIRSLEIDFKNGYLYWGDLSKNEIIKFSLNESVQQKLFYYAIGYPIGLAVDWSSNILYWVDSLMKLIETSTTEGKYRKVLFKLKTEDEPRGITLYPPYGYIFWTDWGVSARIERASLSGTNRITLVSSDIIWPNDLTIDYNNNVLYWIDAKLDILSSVDINGGNRKLIVKLNYNLHPHPFSLAYFDRNVYVSDWTDDAIYLITTSNITQSVFQLKSLLKIMPKRNIGQIKVSGKTFEVFSPCSINNRCSHLCFTLSSTNFACGCPTGMVLSSDNFTCSNAQKHFEIYFTDSGMNAIYQLVKYIDQDGFTIKQFEVPVVQGLLGYPVAIAYLEELEKVYWTDSESQKIYQMNFNGSELKVIKNQSSIGLAIDDISGLMFFFAADTDGTFSLVLSNLNGGNVKTLVSNIHNPQDIVYYNGYVFYSDLDSLLIGRVYSDGTGLIKLTNQDDLPLKITGLAVDSIEERLYWCDQKSHLIESSDLSFSQRRKIIQKTFFFQNTFFLLSDFGEVLDPFDLIVHNERIYWTDLKKKAIFVADKRSGSNIEYVTGGLNQPKRMLITGDIPHEGLRKVYTFSFIMDPKLNKVKCYSHPVCSSGIQSMLSPDKCPSGYKETNYGQSCSNCSDAFGANFKCLCTDWMTCAQRVYADVIGCSPELPFMNFQVRECTQVVRTGYCPYKISECLDLKSCLSDDDCNSSSKCCESLCGLKCVSYLKKSDHPCTINNGNCSHLCLSSKYWHKCDCPDGMSLMSDEKNCENSSTITPGPWNICSMPSDHGPCQNDEIKWSFNPLTKSCQQFLYGGCGGNENNFDSKENCENDCGGNSCNPQNCNNGGYCSNKSLSKCSCVDDWFGTFCQINTKPELVSVIIQIGSRNVSIDDILNAFVSFFSSYCTNNECLYADLSRKRRSSTMNVSFTKDNFYISQFQYQNDFLNIVFAIVSSMDVVMKKESIEAGFRNFSSKFEDFFNVSLLHVGGIKYAQLQRRREHNSVFVPVIVSLIIVISVLLILLVYLKYKKRPFLRHSQVHWSFRNQEYNDTFPHETSLPTDLPPSAPSYINPMFHATNFDHLENDFEIKKIAPKEEIKIEASNWVQFTDDDEPKKFPITEFVTPYDLDLNQSLPLTTNSLINNLYADNTDLFGRNDNPLPSYESVVLSQSTTSLGPRMIKVSSDFSEEKIN
ncbi:low-density lipoprotein receptor-related protein 2 isoform X1 [Hydra vulgaris]|uniref:low-density lipoprotein receptor-related protein 2 isoform X1 n=2 Tax=Hydra vulgaris TaxID=6087 RepID=UPI0032EA44DB